MTRGILPPLDPDAVTRAQAFALEWLAEHSGDGVFDLRGVVLAAGETAPVMRATWNRLADHGLVELYGGRIRVTGKGQAFFDRLDL